MRPVVDLEIPIGVIWLFHNENRNINFVVDNEKYIYKEVGRIWQMHLNSHKLGKVNKLFTELIRLLVRNALENHASAALNKISLKNYLNSSQFSILLLGTVLKLLALFKLSHF